jgi:uncharacterized protein (DUF2252 family)
MRDASLLLTVMVTASACAEVRDDARHLWVVGRLADDNRIHALRDPALVAGKLRRMQGEPYDWFRGTAALYWRDLTEAGPWAWPTAYGDGASSRVLIVGDPHVENLGTFRPADGETVVDWNDFDGAAYGPYWGDVRRLAVSLVLAGGDRLADPLAATTVAGAVARGYAEEIAALAGGAEMRVVSLGTAVVFDELLEDAVEDGDTGVMLARYTRIDGLLQRFMFVGDLAPMREDATYDDTIVPVGADGAFVPLVVARWRATLDGDWPDTAFAIKAYGRRLGAGVASYAMLRLYVALEGPTADLADDWLLEIKETGDGTRIAGLADYGAGFTSAGERVVFAQRAAGARPDADELLGWADLPPRSFRVRHRTGYQKGLDVEDVLGELRDGAGGVNDLATFATLTGAMLARAHVRAPTADGASADAVIDRVLVDHDGFVAETADFATAYAAQVVADWTRANDHDLFAEAYR